MDQQTRIATSRFLSLVLRHQPETLKLTLDSQGWVDVDALLAAWVFRGRGLSREELDEIVTTSPKQRFAFSPDGARIRANQGHSVKVDLAYEARTPPERLFHGTPQRFLPAIQAAGLKKMQRHHVHLSADSQTASTVGERRGTCVVLTIAARRMADDGHRFYQAANGVWLVDAVPAEYISTPE